MSHIDGFVSPASTTHAGMLIEGNRIRNLGTADFRRWWKTCLAATIGFFANHGGMRE